MNPSLRLTVGLLALLLGACATVSEDTQDILSTQATESITVDASSVVNSLQADSIGINMNHLEDGKIANLPQSLSTLGVKLLRYPGGEKSDNYLWSSAPWSRAEPAFARTGPCEWPSADYPGNVAPDNSVVDFDEFMTVARQVGAEPLIVVAFDAMYLGARCGGTAPSKAQLLTNAKEWVRYANRVKGYNIKYWMIGNESFLKSSCDYNGCADATQYASDLVDFVKAMRQVDPSIKIIANGDGYNWWSKVFSIAASHIDYAGLSNYSSYQLADYADYQRSQPSFVQGVEDTYWALQNSAPLTDRNRIKVIISEFNALYFQNWPDLNNLGHALIAFDMMGQQLSHPFVDKALLWNTRWVDVDPTNIDDVRLVAVNNSANNLVVNPGFEATTTRDDVRTVPGWTDGPVVNVSVSNDSQRSGQQSLSIERDTFVTQTIGGLTPTQRYEFEVWAKKSFFTQGWVGAGVDFLDAANNEVGEAVLEFSSGVQFGRYTTSFTLPSSATKARVWLARGSEPATDDRRMYDALTLQGKLRPSGEMLKVWGRQLGEQMVSVTSSSAVRSFASVDREKGTLYVYLINKLESPKPINLYLFGLGNVTAATKRAYGGSGSPQALQPTWGATSSVPVSNRTLSTTLPATSLSVFEIRATLDSPNWVHNGGFELGELDWERVNNNTYIGPEGARSGNQSLIHGKSTSGYQAYSYQTLRGLQNGNYTLSAWFNVIGEHTAITLGAKNCGGPEQTLAIPTQARSDWVNYTLNVNVINSQCELFVWSEAAASDRWLKVDDISLTR